MRRILPTVLLAFTLTGIGSIASPDAQAQRPAVDAAQPAAVAALMRDLASVEEKLLALAEAVPEERFEWRPAEGVRSFGEVMVHIAADNWFLPTVVGVAAPAATGVKANDYPSVQAYEARSMSKTEAISAVRESFAHLRAAMEKADDAQLRQTLNLFGNDVTGVDLWVLTTTHLHEHLGQLIAYARSNSVVPPWSR